MIFDYLEHKSALVIGPPRSEKLLFAEQFLVDGFKSNELGVYIITNDFPESVVSKIRNVHGLGNFHVESGLLKIIDCYSSFIGVPKPETDTVKNVSSPQSLSEISIALGKVMTNNARVVLDSATTLLLHNPFEMVEKFFQSLIGKIRVYNATFFIILEEGTHDPRQIAVLESLTNATVYFRGESKNKFLEIKDASVDRKIPYTVGASGLALREMVEA